MFILSIKCVRKWTKRQWQWHGCVMETTFLSLTPGKEFCLEFSVSGKQVTDVWLQLTWNSVPSSLRLLWKSQPEMNSLSQLSMCNVQWLSLPPLFFLAKEILLWGGPSSVFRNYLAKWDPLFSCISRINHLKSLMISTIQVPTNQRDYRQTWQESPVPLRARWGNGAGCSECWQWAGGSFHTCIRTARMEPLTLAQLLRFHRRDAINAF